MTPTPSLVYPAQLPELRAVIEFLHHQGWTPATSSNFSLRDNSAESTFWVSASGMDKRCLSDNDFIPVSLQGHPLSSDKSPSAETALHAWIYQHYPQTTCVLHTHSLNATRLSLQYQHQGAITFAHLEILKAFQGITTHQSAVRLPIVGNAQCMATIIEELTPIAAQYHQQSEPFWGFLIAGHGLYTWGNSVAEAQRHLEAWEFLLAYQRETLLPSTAQ